MSANWQRMGREFSRTWRRGKVYRDSELRQLARKRGLVLRQAGNGRVDVVQGKEVVARFRAVGDAAPVNETNVPERLEAYAALKL